MSAPSDVSTSVGTGSAALGRDSSSDHHRLLTVGIAVLGIFVTYVPVTSVSVTLTTIGTTTRATTSDLQWVSDGYVIPMAAAVLSAGLFGDRYGRRRVFLAGLALTMIGATVAGLSAARTGSTALHLLWAGQALCGLGAGMLLPTTLALIAHAVPDARERGRYIGLWATGLMLGLAVGPLMAGVILEHGGYGWTFAPTVALAALAGIAALARLPESKAPEPRPFDWPGQLTATAAITASIYGVIEGGAQGWSSPACLAGLGIGAAAFVAFVIAEARSSAPLLRLSLFRSAAFTTAGLSALIALFSVVGTVFLLSLYLGYVQRLTALQIGLRLLFMSGVAAAFNPVVGATLQKFRAGYLLAAGLGLSSAGVLLLTGLNPHTGAVDLGWRLAVFGLSIAIMLTTVSTAAVNAVPWQLAGMASAANTVMRQYGGALGPAILGTIFAARTASGATPTAALHTALVVDASLLFIAALACLATTRRFRV
ncbi:MFS transporter [Streptomyces nojiriensis]|uniref:MFS transporter n=1 Tax=Streptomyces nojiriensis TaxID=66374 RepID=UPI00365A2CD1